jgi:murein DD-endopeptidase MepM/ murein hydrolase activator NlpD
LALLICLPLRRLHVNSSFGYRWHPMFRCVRFHEGVDLYARHDTTFAVLDGSVRRVSKGKALGLSIILRHGAVESIYGHLQQTFVKQDDTVTTGQPVGITGASGQVTGEHLHFSVRYHRRFIDPIEFLQLLLR